MNSSWSAHHGKTNIFIIVHLNVSDHDILDTINWETVGYIDERRLAIEACKIKVDLKGRLPPFINVIVYKQRYISGD